MHHLFPQKEEEKEMIAFMLRVGNGEQLIILRELFY
jgi:hypothetical protein